MKHNEIEYGSEIVINAVSEVGVVSRISSTLAENKINIRAICAYEIEDTGHLRIVTDDNSKATTILKKAGFKAHEHQVLMCEVSPNTMHPETAELVGDHDVENYWCASEHGSEHALLVFSPKNSLMGVRLK